jgi:hypothetical protein
MPKYTIFAPHIDDELIGCFSLFEKGEVEEVVYFYDLTDERLVEADNLKIKYGHKYRKYIGESFNISPATIIVAPHINDNHPHHKVVNFISKQYSNKKIYYSVDMNTTFRVLSNEEQKNKYDLLLSIYPSQSDLLKNDHKYSLFESLQHTDVPTYIEVKTQFEGFHSYPDAPDVVSFLRNKHRHIFYVELKVQVFHDDREIEFFMLKNDLNMFVHKLGNQLNNKSCEMLCNIFINFINNEYEQRNVIVKVSEDNENSAIVEQIYWR